MTQRGAPAAAGTGEPGRAAWSVGARSDAGCVRDENQDRFARIASGIGEVFVVCDGMGGHQAGALAAELAVQVLRRELDGAAAGGDGSAAAALVRAIEAANRAVHARGHCGDPQTRAMGTTLVALVSAHGWAQVGHVGDSRAYLCRAGRLRRLTADHTRLQRLVDAGLVQPAQALDHPDAGLLERAVGHRPEVEVALGDRLELRDGDDLLLCSDGLHGPVDDAEIEAVLATRRAPQQLADELVARALARGGPDNVTALVIRPGAAACADAPADAAPPEPAGAATGPHAEADAGAGANVGAALAVVAAALALLAAGYAIERLQAPAQPSQPPSARSGA